MSARRATEGLEYLDAAVAMGQVAHLEPERYQEYNIDRFLRNRSTPLQDVDEAVR